MRNLCLLLFAFAAAFALALSGCEGDQGPVGPVGPEGPQGPMGENGAQNCVDCHGNNQLITAKMFQWEHSVHATGGHFERNRTSCAICHTSQGFIERLETGEEMTAEDIADPLPINCYTCHKIHQTYTEADWELTQTEPVTLWVTGETLDLGKANLCISCHQSRRYSPSLPDPGTGGTVEITNFRYGPHHGPQGEMLPGIGGYEVPGSVAYENTAHTALLANNVRHACVACHMAAAEGVASGGHTFHVVDEDGAINEAACMECHTDGDALEDLVADRQMQIETRLEELRQLLIARGKLDPDNDRAITGTYEGHEAGALFNYRFVQEDRSLGVHNFKYANALLSNSIEALQ